MPETTIVPPKAPAPAPKPGAPSAFPSSSGEIKVAPPATPKGPAPAAKPESAKAKLFDELGKKAGGRQAEPVPSVKEEPVKTPPAKSPEPGEESGLEDSPEAEIPSKEGEQPAKPGEAPADKLEKNGKKPSPWKLVEDYKGRLTKAETEIAELRKNVLPEQDRKAYEDRASKAEARVKELEQHLTFVDYSKTEEFKTKYEQPYQKAWGRAMKEIGELRVPDGNGGERKISADDLLGIVNAPLGQARQIAVEMFGDFADDVMGHRKEIRSLFEAQVEALEDAKKNGLERVKQAQETQKKTLEDISKSVRETWMRENDAIQKSEKYATYFKPREGDEQWNQRLSKGYELVDKAFSENPARPDLKPEEREAIIRRHAAVRNRAASWGALRGEVERLSSELKAAHEELAQYKESEPGTVGERRTNPAVAPTSGNAKANLMEELKKRAK